MSVSRNEPLRKKKFLILEKEERIKIVSFEILVQTLDQDWTINTVQKLVRNKNYFAPATAMSESALGTKESGP